MSAWHDRLAKEERALGLSEGFKLVFGPAGTLEGRAVAFLSQKPGRASIGASLRTLSDERGNSYEVEARTTLSPITAQFLRLARFLGRRPSDILTGVASPFRASAWADLTPAQRSRGLALGREFWDGPLRMPALRLIVAVSQEAADLAVDATHAVPCEDLPSGWGGIRIRVLRGSSGVRVVHLPHLSRFRLFGRAESEPHLRHAFAGFAA